MCESRVAARLNRSDLHIKPTSLFYRRSPLGDGEMIVLIGIKACDGDHTADCHMDFLALVGALLRGYSNGYKSVRRVGVAPLGRRCRARTG
jgi:hypothetical protein